MKAIKVGLIRCDLHALYYGALMFKHDPIVLRDDSVTRGHAAHFYFYTHYNDPRKIMVPTVGPFTLAKVWDPNPNTAGHMPGLWPDTPGVCDNFEQVSDDVDLVFIADCNGDGSDHLKLATPGVEKGVPTFIDKPLAYDVADAQAIVRLAKKHNTPVMSLSMLRTVPHATRFRNRLAELDHPEFGIVKGGGEDMAGHIHAISLAQHVFGHGVEAVETMGRTPLAYVHLDYGENPNRPQNGVVLNCASGRSPHCAFYVSAYSSVAAVHSPPIGDFEFPWGAAANLRMIKKMVQTNTAPVEYDQMIENIAVATAARLAQASRRRVRLDEIMV